MVAWLEPLQLQTIFISIFAGDPQYFIALAIIVIASMAGYFRMTMLTFFFMIGLFFLMISEYAISPMLIFISIIAGLVIGYVVSRLWQ